MKLSKGYRVVDTTGFFGAGTVEEEGKKGTWLESYTSVLWDTAPPVAYNWGSNPCITQTVELVLEVAS